MLILNITFLVTDHSKEKWLKWVKESHIPFMMNSGYFTSPQIARVLSSENTDNISYAVQFQTDSITTLEKWNKEYSALFQQLCTTEFTDADVLFFSTVLEIV